MEIPEEILKHVSDPSIPKSYREQYLKAWSDPCKKNIIRAKCIECLGFEEVTIRVRDCDIKVCPLHNIRLRYFGVSRQHDSNGE